MNILCAIEDSLLAELLAFRLELLGHHVNIANTARQLLQGLEETSYSLAVIDTALPDANIRETLAKLRSSFPKESLAVLVVSVDQSLELVEQVVRCGADDYLLAPFDPQTLQSKLERLLGRIMVQFA